MPPRKGAAGKPGDAKKAKAESYLLPQVVVKTCCCARSGIRPSLPSVEERTRRAQTSARVEHMLLIQVMRRNGTLLPTWTPRNVSRYAANLFHMIAAPITLQGPYNLQ